MVKRTGDNLARTEDGSTYNKLQRPDNWPLEPSRRVSSDVSQTKEEEEFMSDGGSEDNEPDEEDATHDDGRSGVKQEVNREQRIKLRRLGHSSGCLSLDYGDEDTGVSLAALEYLRTVREEAEGGPLFSACHADGEDLTEEDYRGYYDNGAYIVAPDHGPLLPKNSDAETLRNTAITPYEAYTTALLLHFYDLRQFIRNAQASVIPDAEKAKPFFFDLSASNKTGERGRRGFEKLLKEPMPVRRLVATRRDDHLQILQIVCSNCLKRGSNLSSNLGQWIFATLAALDETTLNSDDIAILRDLAKKSFLLRVDLEPKYDVTADWPGHEHAYLSDCSEHEELTPTAVKGHCPGRVSTNGDQPTVSEDHSCEPEQAPKRDDLSDLIIDEYVPNDVTKTTLDMITTIVGEVFGQRDLLESRFFLDWPEVVVSGSDVESAAMDIE